MERKPCPFRTPDRAIPLVPEVCCVAVAEDGSVAVRKGGADTVFCKIQTVQFGEAGLQMIGASILVKPVDDVRNAIRTVHHAALLISIGLA
jgi:hypothetical protein